MTKKQTVKTRSRQRPLDFSYLRVVEILSTEQLIFTLQQAYPRVINRLLVYHASKLFMQSHDPFLLQFEDGSWSLTRSHIKKMTESNRHMSQTFA